MFLDHAVKLHLFAAESALDGLSHWRPGPYLNTFEGKPTPLNRYCVRDFSCDIVFFTSDVGAFAAGFLPGVLSRAAVVGLEV